MAKPAPPPEPNISAIRTAEMLIERYGAGALAEAEAQAERLAQAGSAASAEEWRAVAAAIRHILATNRRG